MRKYIKESVPTNYTLNDFYHWIESVQKNLEWFIDFWDNYSDLSDETGDNRFHEILDDLTEGYAEVFAGSADDLWSFCFEWRDEVEKIAEKYKDLNLG